IVMPANTSPRDRLVAAWLALQHAEHGSQEYEKSWWALEEVDNLCHQSPDVAWDFILATLARDCSAEILGMLSAGPLEDLLARHGALVVDRVEAEARRDPHFAN